MEAKECLKWNHLAGMNFAVAADFVGARITDVIHRTSLIALLPGSAKELIEFAIRIVEQNCSRIDHICRLASCFKGLIYVQLHLDCHCSK